MSRCRSFSAPFSLLRLARTVRTGAQLGVLLGTLLGMLGLALALPCAAPAETLLWPVTGELRECPEFMDMALYSDMHAGNTLIIQGDVPGDVAGAVAYAPLNPPRNAVEAQALASPLPRGNGAARRNTVLLQRGVVEGFVDGGWSGMGPARDNMLVISGGTVRKLARGGGSNGGPAEGNVLHMTAGRVEGSAIGGSSLRHAASGNTLTLSHGEVRDAAVGGSSSFGPAESNTVHMSGGRAASVVGGSSGHGNAQGNAVHVWGGVVTRDIVGGETTQGELTTQNTVTLGRHAQLSPEVRIFGGLKLPPPGTEPAPLPTSGTPRNEFLFKGNVLKVQWQGRVRALHHFQYWEFTLPDAFRPGDTLLTVDEPVDLRLCVLRLMAALPDSVLQWQPGDSATLLRAPALLAEGVQLPPTLTTTGTAKTSAAQTNVTTATTTKGAQAKPLRLEFALELDNARAPTAVLLKLVRITG